MAAAGAINAIHGPAPGKAGAMTSSYANSPRGVFLFVLVNHTIEYNRQKKYMQSSVRIKLFLARQKKVYSPKMSAVKRRVDAVVFI